MSEPTADVPTRAPIGSGRRVSVLLKTGILPRRLEDQSRRPLAARALPFPFVLVGRAENFLHGRPDLDDTIKRLQAFEAAGADALYAPGLAKADDVRTVCASVSK